MAMKISTLSKDQRHDCRLPLNSPLEMDVGFRRDGASVTVIKRRRRRRFGLSGHRRSSRPFSFRAPFGQRRDLRPARSRDRPRTPPPARRDRTASGFVAVARRDGPSADLSLHEGGEPVDGALARRFPQGHGKGRARGGREAILQRFQAGHAAICGSTQRLGDVGDLGHGGQRLGEGLAPRYGEAEFVHGGLGLGGGHGGLRFGLGGRPWPRRFRPRRPATASSAARRASSASAARRAGLFLLGAASGLPWRLRPRRPRPRRR